MTLQRYVILDRDGTLNVECHHLSDPDQIRLLPGVVTGLKALRASGLGTVVVTNQSVVGRGMVTAEGLNAIHARLEELLAAAGVTLDGVYACPHRPNEGCRCRKPAPGLVERAAREHGFDPRQSVVIGDSATDIRLGRNVGARALLVTTGYGRATLESGDVEPDFVSEDFSEAAQVAIRLLT